MKALIAKLAATGVVLYGLYKAVSHVELQEELQFREQQKRVNEAASFTGGACDILSGKWVPKNEVSAITIEAFYWANLAPKEN